MGSKDPVRDVEDKVPGLRFSVKESSRAARFGIVTLHCIVNDVEMWDNAVEKLDGLKLFSTTSQEVMDALGEELTLQVKEVGDLGKLMVKLQRELDAQIAKNNEMQAMLTKIGIDLGLT